MSRIELALALLLVAGAPAAAAQDCEQAWRTASEAAGARDAVLLAGGFVSPGPVKPARLSELVARSGGLLDEAFSYGTVTLVLPRLDDRRATERERKAAIERERTLQSLRSHGSASASLMAMLESRVALGPLSRIAGEADPAVLAANPRSDPALLPGDIVFLPLRPEWVAVWGEVRSPGRQPFVPGALAETYLEAAGGPTGQAAPGNAFMVLPDGSTRDIKVRYWNYQKTNVPPGSLLVVPPRVPVTYRVSSRDVRDLLVEAARMRAGLELLCESSPP